MDWIVLLIAIGAIGSLVIEFYHRIYRERKKIEGIFLKPILKNISSLKEQIEQYCIPSFNSLSDLFKNNNSEVTNTLINLKEDLEHSVENYRVWLSEANDFIRGNIWYIVYRQGTTGNMLAKEYEKKGRGDLGEILIQFLAHPILEGQKITISWFKSNADIEEKYIESIEECERHRDFKKILGSIDKIRDRQILKKLREERDLLLKYLDKKLESHTINQLYFRGKSNLSGIEYLLHPGSRKNQEENI